MAIVASSLARIKSDPLAVLGGEQRVNSCFAKAGHVWRNAVLTPAATVRLFMLQILHGNVAISGLRHVSEVDVADSSYCDARQRLPLSGVAALVSQVCGEAVPCGDAAGGDAASGLRGHRIVIADATSTITPDTPALQKQWPQAWAQKPGCGFPAIKLLGLLDRVSGMILHLTMMCLDVHEFSQLEGMHQGLITGDVLLGDRGFCSFAHVAMLLKRSVFAVFRMHQQQIVDFTPNRRHRVKGAAGMPRRKRGRGKAKRERGIPTSQFIKRLGHEDQIVAWVKPAHCPTWMRPDQFQAMPATIQVRELRYRITVRGRRTRVVTIATTLLDPMRYPKHQIAGLYGMRWEIETNFRHLKTTMKMEHLKCKSVEGCLKELMIYVLVYNLVRAAMVLAAERQRVADPGRISFIDTMRALASAWHRPRPGLILRLRVNKPRTGRWCPRVKKRRMKEYELMNKPRNQYIQPAEPIEVAA